MAGTSPAMTSQQPPLRSIACQNHVLDQRIDLQLPAPAAEDAVMADAELQVMALEIGAQARAHLLRRQRLADRADVVALAFDREQHGAADRARLDLVAAPCQRPKGERMLLEDEPHG